VTHYLAVKEDITQRKQMEEQIRQLAFHDSLTDLPNRRLLMDRLAQAMAAGKRSQGFGALMFLDLDNFKPLNDQHGHAVGDLLLVKVAHRLKACVRAVDTVSRIGGDEFVVLLRDLTADPVTAAEQANRLAEKILLALSQPYLLSAGKEARNIEHHCTASIGVVLFSQEHQNLEDLLKWADAAMYQSKAEGRNRITLMRERRAEQRV
jgi:diguanylate cyclase (GGDEF)-like protein